MSKLWSRVTRALGAAGEAPAPGDATAAPDAGPGEATTTDVPADAESFFQDKVMPRMIEELRSSSVDVRRAAISVIRSAGAEAEHAIPALFELFERPTSGKDVCEEYARKEAAYAIEEIRRLCKREIEEREKRERETAKAAAAAAAAPRPDANGGEPLPLDETARALLVALDDQVAAVRVSAVEALVRRGERHPDISIALRSALHDSSADVRQRAAWALGQLG